MGKYITIGIMIVSALLIAGVMWGVFDGPDSDYAFAVHPDTPTTAVSLVTLRSPDMDMSTSTPTPEGIAYAGIRNTGGDGILVVDVVEVRVAEARAAEARAAKEAAMTATITATLSAGAPQKLLKISSDLIAIKQALEYRRAEALKKHGKKKGWDRKPLKPEAPAGEKQLYEEFRQVQAQAQMQAPEGF